MTANLAGEPVRQGSMGRPLPGIETRIAGGDDDGVGELQLRAASSPTFFSRYLDGERFEGEWWPTGDLVRADADGYLFFEGRDDDIILSSGYRIGPFEVESALQSHPAVAEAAAVAAPDPERGSVVRAIVVPRDREPSEELARELQEHCKRVAAPYKFPRIVEFVAELPKTSSGKIKRAQLRGGLDGSGSLGQQALGRVDRAAEVVALGHVDAVLAQHLRRLVVLDELGDRRLAEAAGDLDDRLHGQLVGVVARHVADEGAVDLDHVEGDRASGSGRG